MSNNFTPGLHNVWLCTFVTIVSHWITLKKDTDSFQLIMVILKKKLKKIKKNKKKIAKCDQGCLFSRILTILGAFATVYSQNRALSIHYYLCCRLPHQFWTVNYTWNLAAHILRRLFIRHYRNSTNGARVHAIWWTVGECCIFLTVVAVEPLISVSGKNLDQALQKFKVDYVRTWATL